MAMRIPRLRSQRAVIYCSNLPKIASLKIVFSRISAVTELKWDGEGRASKSAIPKTLTFVGVACAMAKQPHSRRELVHVRRLGSIYRRRQQRHSPAKQRCLSLQKRGLPSALRARQYHSQQHLRLRQRTSIDALARRAAQFFYVRKQHRL